MLALHSMLLPSYYAPNYAGIIGSGLTGIPSDHCPSKVVAYKGQKKVRTRTSENKSQVTLCKCDWSSYTPLVIFDAKMLNLDWAKGQVPGTRYGLSATGWVDTHLFKKWLTDHLLKKIDCICQEKWSSVVLFATAYNP